MTTWQESKKSGALHPFLPHVGVVCTYVCPIFAPISPNTQKNMGNPYFSSPLSVPLLPSSSPFRSTDLCRVAAAVRVDGEKDQNVKEARDLLFSFFKSFFPILFTSLLVVRGAPQLLTTHIRLQEMGLFITWKKFCSDLEWPLGEKIERITLREGRAEEKEQIE